MQKTSKHVSLRLALKNLTSSKEVITLFNRYGHGISYDQVLDMEMRLAENLLEGKEHDVIFQVVSLNTFSIFRWDNTDLLEETLSGGGTTHCTKASFKLCFTTKVFSSVKIGREVMLEADRDLFARLLVVAQTREMDLREVFKYFLWFAKCSINLYLCSKNIFFIQQFTVIFNILYLCSTMRILFSYSTKLFSFNNNIIVINEMEYNGVNSGDQTDIAEMLNSFFTEIGPGLSRDVSEVDKSFEEFLIETDKNFVFEKTTPTHVFALLSKLCKSKATGLDNISAKLLRECPDVLAESLTAFNIY